MSTQLQLRRGTTAQHSTFTGASGEITIDTDKKTVVVHDGTTAGGRALPQFDSSGNLGIGTASPASKLDVNGTITVGSCGNILPTYFGYSSGYHVLSFYKSGNYSLALNYDPSINNSSLFSGDGREIILRNGTCFTTPNAANNSWLPTLTFQDGNLGLGVTPSAWTTFPAFQNTAGSFWGYRDPSGGQLYITQNVYYNSGFKYVESKAASMYQQNGGSHAWSIAPSGTAGNAITFTQAMTLDSSGTLTVGKPNTNAGVSAKFIGGDSGNGSEILVVQTYNGTTCMRVMGSGNVQNTNNSYGAISDQKLKENIVDASPKLADLCQVKVRNFNFIGSDLKQIGVIAQELEEVFPSMVDETPDYEELIKTREVEVPAVLDEDGNEVEPATTKTEEYSERVATGTTTKSVKYSVFVPMLIKAVQEQQAIIESLTQRIEALEYTKQGE